MPYAIPNAGTAPSNVDQAEPDATDIDILVAGWTNTGVRSGCAVTAQGTPDVTVAVAAGVVVVAGVAVAVTGGNLTIAVGNATNPRKDLVVVDNAGTKSVVAGTAAAQPLQPAVPANSVVLATVYVPALNAVVTSSLISDRRVVLDTPSLVAANTFSSPLGLAWRHPTNSGLPPTLTTKLWLDTGSRDGTIEAKTTKAGTGYWAHLVSGTETKSVTNVGTITTTAGITFTSGDIDEGDEGAFITGTGIPALATIVSVDSATTATISANATATGTVTVTVTQTTGGQILGIGVGDPGGGGGKGIVFDLRGGSLGNASSQGIILNTFSNLGGPASYAVFGQHGTTNYPMMRLEQQVAGAGTLIDLRNTVSSVGQRLMAWAGFKPTGAGWGGNNEGGFIDGSTGALVLKRGQFMYQSNPLVFSAGGETERTFSSHFEEGVTGTDLILTMRPWAATHSLDTTLSATASPGATSISTAATALAGQLIRISHASNADFHETRLVTSVSGAGPYTVNFADPLVYAHASGQQVYAGLFYTSVVRTNGAALEFRQASGATWAGGETLDTLLTLEQGRNVRLVNSNAPLGGGFGAVGVGNVNAGFIPAGTVSNGAVLYANAGFVEILNSDGVKFKTQQRASVSVPTSAGSVVDSECRQAVADLYSRLQATGLVA